MTGRWGGRGAMDKAPVRDGGPGSGPQEGGTKKQSPEEELAEAKRKRYYIGLSPEAKALRERELSESRAKIAQMQEKEGRGGRRMWSTFGR